MATDAQKRATMRYEKHNVKRVTVKFFPDDMEMYEHVRSQPSMMGYIKELIRKDMEAGR